MQSHHTIHNTNTMSEDQHSDVVAKYIYNYDPCVLDNEEGKHLSCSKGKYRLVCDCKDPLRYCLPCLRRKSLERPYEGNMTELCLINTNPKQGVKCLVCKKACFKFLLTKEDGSHDDPKDTGMELPVPFGWCYVVPQPDFNTYLAMEGLFKDLLYPKFKELFDIQYQITLKDTKPEKKKELCHLEETLLSTIPAWAKDSTGDLKPDVGMQPGIDKYDPCTHCLYSDGKYRLVCDCKYPNIMKRYCMPCVGYIAKQRPQQQYMKELCVQNPKLGVKCPSCDKRCFKFLFTKKDGSPDDPNDTGIELPKPYGWCYVVPQPDSESWYKMRHIFQDLLYPKFQDLLALQKEKCSIDTTPERSQQLQKLEETLLSTIPEWAKDNTGNLQPDQAEFKRFREESEEAEVKKFKLWREKREDLFK